MGQFSPIYPNIVGSKRFPVRENTHWEGESKPDDTEIASLEITFEIQLVYRVPLGHITYYTITYTLVFFYSNGSRRVQ